MFVPPQTSQSGEENLTGTKHNKRIANVCESEREIERFEEQNGKLVNTRETQTNIGDRWSLYKIVGKIYEYFLRGDFLALSSQLTDLLTSWLSQFIEIAEL